MTRALITYRVLVVFVILGLTTGCWDRNEMDDLALVIASGIDLTDDGQLEITLQIALPSGIPSAVKSGGSTKKSVIVISAIGKNSSEVTGKLQQQLSRAIYFGHRSVIIFGEQFARHGINKVVDTFTRLPETRANSYVLTTYGGTAKEILNTPYQLELIPGIGINKIQSSKLSFPVKIDEFLNVLSSEDRSPVTAAIRVIHKGTNKESFTIDRAAVYHRNQLSGYLSSDELKILRWWTGGTNHLRFTVQVEEENEQYGGIVGVELLHSGMKMHSVIKNNLPEVGVSLHASVRAIDNDSKLDLSNIDQMKRVETLLSKQIQSEAESMLTHVQNEFQSDIFGIGEEIHIKHPYAWKKMKDKWLDIFPEVPVTVNAHIKIERTGKTRSPAHKEKTD